MEKLVRKIALVAHDAMKKDLIEWVLWNSELLMGHKFYCTGTTGTLILEALREKHPDVEWDFTSSNIKYIDKQLVTVSKVQMICKCK